MEGSKSCIDELRNFFLTQDRGQRRYPFRIGRLGCAPDPLKCLGVEEPQSRKIYRDGARCELSLREQFRLVFANLLRPQGGQENARSVAKNLSLSRCNCVW